MKIFQHDFKTLRVKDGFLVVTLCWFFSAAVGAVPFVVTGSIPNPIDAFFESCSGFSTTGASILTDVEILPKGILFWRSFTHWIGGMGILVFAIALMPSLGISGQNIAVTEAPGPIMDKTSAQMSKTAKTLYIMYLIFTVLEVILLLFGGMNLFDALVHTFGSVGTGGFSSYNDSVAHFNSTYIEVVIMVFMVLCGSTSTCIIWRLRTGFLTCLKTRNSVLSPDFRGICDFDRNHPVCYRQERFHRRSSSRCGLSDCFHPDYYRIYEFRL